MDQKDGSMSLEQPNARAVNSPISISDHKLKRLISWAVVSGTAVATVGFFAFLTYHAVWGKATPETWPTAMIDKHFAAMVGTPLSAMTAYCIVSLLKVTNGPVEFEALGFKFQGASGPIILWVFSFLALGTIFHLLLGNV
jgi:hypothetical protein